MSLARAVLAVRAWIEAHDRNLDAAEQSRAYAAARDALAACPDTAVLAQTALAEATRDLRHLPAGMAAGPRLLPLSALPPYAIETILRLWPALDPAQTVVVVDPERLVVGPTAPSIPSLPPIPSPGGPVPLPPIRFDAPR
jgi:hypothetical protein